MRLFHQIKKVWTCITDLKMTYLLHVGWYPVKSAFTVHLSPIGEGKDARLVGDLAADLSILDVIDICILASE